jgi:hypothetical protein
MRYPSWDSPWSFGRLVDANHDEWTRPIAKEDGVAEAAPDAFTDSNFSEIDASQVFRSRLRRRTIG